MALGDLFLKHVERTKVLVHMIDVSNEVRDPVADFKAIVRELALFNEDMLEQETIGCCV